MTVQVGKLTVRTAQRGAGRDAGFRVRTESRLRSLDLRPPGLPDRAVLVVRRMDLARVDGSTAQRTRAALAGLRQGAPRPAAGPVGASASAVLFGDEVELLACLTADLADGVASRRWYWRAVLPAASAEGGTALAAAWMSRIRWLPGQPRPAPRARGEERRVPPLPAGHVEGAAGPAGRLRGRRAACPAFATGPTRAQRSHWPHRHQPAQAGGWWTRHGGDGYRPPPCTRRPRPSWGWRSPSTTPRPSCAGPPTRSGWRPGGRAPGDANGPQAPAGRAARPGGPPGTASPGPGQSITASPGTVSPGTAPSTGPPPAQAGQGTGPLTSAPSAEVRTVAESPAVPADAGTTRHAPTAVSGPRTARPGGGLPRGERSADSPAAPGGTARD